ncbi:acyl carrier protein [bacterium]|nr:acyl carrier protein [bacterium]
MCEVVGSKISFDTPLMEAGIDSLGATELQNQLNAVFDADLPATLLFDHPSISGITDLVVELRKDNSAVSPEW